MLSICFRLSSILGKFIVKTARRIRKLLPKILRQIATVFRKKNKSAIKWLKRKNRQKSWQKWMKNKQTKEQKIKNRMCFIEWNWKKKSEKLKTENKSNIKVVILK